MTFRPLAIIIVFAHAFALEGCNAGPRDAIVSSPASILADGAVAGAGYDSCGLDPGTPYWSDHGGWPAYTRRCMGPPPK